MLRLTIPGDPMPKNAKHDIFVRRAGSGGRSIGRKNSERYDRFCEIVALVWDRERARQGLTPISAGLWRITVRAFWPKRDKQLGVSVFVPKADVDAPLECTLDALKEAGAIDSDARFISLSAEKFYDPQNPRTEVEIEPVENWRDRPTAGPKQEEMDLF